MRKCCALLLMLLAALLLTGCSESSHEGRVLVVLEETPGCEVADNGQLVLPGEDVTFTLQLERGWSLISADYSGTYDLETSGRTAALTLHGVQLPTRVRLNLSTRYATITYLANGGQGTDGTDSISRRYSLTVRQRPNTERGLNLFYREGYTLTGWNTRADGSGTAVGLGSRVTVTGGALTLYAQWAQWADAASFDYDIQAGGLCLTGWHGTAERLVIPALIGGQEVTRIAAGAFAGCTARQVVLPVSLQTVEPGAFEHAALEELTFCDNMVSLPDSAFDGCENLRTFRINAVEFPYGYLYRKESCYADKVDLLLLSQDKNRLVAYGGCSMWYNLDGLAVDQALAGRYTLVNMGLNGTVSSAVQLQIMAAYLHPGDILLHTPELASADQLMQRTGMDEGDGLLWCGIENNYDLAALVDARTVDGMLDSLCAYLSQKDKRTDYLQAYADEQGNYYLDGYGCVPFYRSTTADSLPDRVSFSAVLDEEETFDTLNSYYTWLQGMGVTVYVSCACTNVDALPAGELELADAADAALRQKLAAPVISALGDYLYHRADFYDTNYHLNTLPAKANTRLWLRDLTAQLRLDGLWEETP